MKSRLRFGRPILSTTFHCPKQVIRLSSEREDMQSYTAKALDPEGLKMGILARLFACIKIG